MSIGSPPRGGYWAVNVLFGIVVGFGFVALLEVGHRIFFGAP